MWEQTEENFLVQSLILPHTVLDHRQHNSRRTSQDQPGLNRGFRVISRQAWTLELVRKGRKQEAQLCGGCLVAKLYLTLLWPHGLSSSSLLCPWVSPDKKIGLDCHFLLQGNLLDSGIEPTSSSLQVDSLPLGHQGMLRPPLPRLSDMLSLRWRRVFTFQRSYQLMLILLIKNPVLRTMDLAQWKEKKVHK